jgi:hypothetical protein
MIPSRNDIQIGYSITDGDGYTLTLYDKSEDNTVLWWISPYAKAPVRNEYPINEEWKSFKYTESSLVKRILRKYGE